MLSEHIAVIFVAIAFVCWALSEYKVMKQKYTNGEGVSKEARVNNNLLIFATAVSFVSLFLSLYLNANHAAFGFYPNFILSYVGSAIALLGVIIRRVAINTLNQHFDCLIQVKEEQKLITHGLYKKFRHPSYTATIVTFFGFGMASMNIVNILLFPAMFYVVYHYRTKLEEEVLEAGFGEEYRVYKQNTYKLFPVLKIKKRENVNIQH